MSQFRFCSACGNSLLPHHKFCTQCGNVISRVREQGEYTPPPPPPPRSRETVPAPKPTKVIEVEEEEAEEIASALIFHAGAVLPWKSKEGTLISPDEDDVRSVKFMKRFIDKLLIVYPQFNNSTWLGYEEYQKVTTFLAARGQERAKTSSPRPEPIQHTRISASPSQVPSSTSSVEQIRGAIVNCKTWFPEIHYILFLTDRRIIAAKKGLFDSLSEAGAATGGIMGAIIGAGLDATVNRDRIDKYEELRQLSPEKILAQDKANTEMLYDNINVIELKTPGFLSDGEITIKTSGREYNLLIEVEKDVFKQVIAMFQKIVPEKVIIK